MGLTFEYTAPYIPQHIGRPERKFATLFGMVRSMLNSARVTKELREKLWAECAKTATMIANTSVYDLKRAYEKFSEKEAPHARHLRKFGEIGIIKDHAKIKGKLDHRGKACLSDIPNLMRLKLFVS